MRRWMILSIIAILATTAISAAIDLHVGVGGNNGLGVGIDAGGRNPPGTAVGVGVGVGPGGIGVGVHVNPPGQTPSGVPIPNPPVPPVPPLPPIEGPPPAPVPGTIEQELSDLSDAELIQLKLVCAYVLLHKSEFSQLKVTICELVEGRRTLRNNP